MVAVLTTVHVLISIIGILSGFFAMFEMLARRQSDRLVAIFLATTTATSLTGFFFPFHQITPAIIVGIVSLAVLAISVFARYARYLVGHWRWIYVVTAVIALYLNVFV